MMSEQQQQVVQQQASTVSQTSSVSMQQTRVQQQRQEQTRVVREVRQGTQMIQGPVQMVPTGLPAGASPPVFEQIFKNARFAQGGDATFEGKVQGNPKPSVTWTRKGQPIASGNKYQVTHDSNTGVVTLLIRSIGPGDEGEYTCTASNQYGEAICTVFIQPEAAYMMQQQRQQSLQSRQTQMQQQQMQQRSFLQQQQQIMHSERMETFKVDTFEYRLLHEVEFRQSITQRLAGEVDMEVAAAVEGPPLAPQVQQKPRSTKMAEGADANFSLAINANPSPRVTWFRNGERIVLSEKHQMSQTTGHVNFLVKSVSSSDSGYYTMLAENSSGCTVASAQLAVVPKGSEIENGVLAPEAMRPGRAVQEMEIDVDSDESAKSLEPKFLKISGDQTVQEGKMVRFDCRVTGKPYPEVTWLLNGNVIINDEHHKVLVNEQGNHSLMITQTSIFDSGIITCVARNKSGETAFQCHLNVLEREEVVPPKFVERFPQCQVNEGETVVLHARAVGTPAPVLTWQKDGVAVQQTENVQFQSEGGASVLQILSATGADAGWYQCTAHNVAGSTATRARLHVKVDKSAHPTAQRPHFPKPVKVIEPEKEPEPEVIFLRHVERAHHQIKGPEDEQPTEPPKFTHPMRDLEAVEGTRAHFEAKVTPVGDATMQVEWLIDGRPLAASSRATTTYRFGYVALDILGVIQSDAGVYTCRVTNAMGQDETSANLRITERPIIESTSQHPGALEQISYLEDASRYQRSISTDEYTTVKPAFVRPLTNLGEVLEGKYAHFEAQLHPVSDPFMRIEWFKDGKTITASSRINVIYNFGYVALNIMHLRPEDSGTYTVKATNKAGECTCEATIKVLPMSSVTCDLGIPEQAQYIRSVEEMEAYRLQMAQKSAQEMIEASTPPVFKSDLKDTAAREGGYAHFEARLEPIGDPTLKVEWLKDNRPIEASSRITSFFNFGYVALTIKSLIIQDAGVYTCRAYNAKGDAQVSCQLTILAKTDIEVDSQYDEALMRMQFLEDSSRYQRTQTEETTISTMAPKFLGPLKGTNKIVEGQKAHFEARLEPQGDPTLTVEWYFNGKAIMSAARTKCYNDFGYVAIDISDVRSTDTGTYTVVARNSLGETQLSTTMQVEVRSYVDYTSMHQAAIEKSAALERQHREPQYHVEEMVKSKPEFTQPLQNLPPMPEGRNIHLEARLEPMNDPTMKVEWYCNGRPVTIGSRFKTYFDFGYVALDVIGAYTTDSGEYTCRAQNALGSAHTSASVQVLGTGDIYTETMHDAAMEHIQYLEGSKAMRTMLEERDVNEPPAFAKSLKNIETIEGTNIHLEARLQPLGDPTMRVDWFFNDQPLRVGHRFRTAYDFDYVALDLLSVYPNDSGIYTCRATNKLGQSVTSASVKVHAKKDLVFDSEHPESLQKLQFLEDSSRYQRKEQLEELAITIKPRFLNTIKDLHLKEGMNAHFEAKLEPIADSSMKVEWFKDGKPVPAGSRFRTLYDFGYVALDIRQLVAEDSGVYTCIATNKLGRDEISATLMCQQSSTIIMETQTEFMTSEQIRMLEERRKFTQTQQIEEITTQAPVFTTSLKNVDIIEGQRAHFEARLIPTSDATMKVEWFQNGQPIKSGTRFTEYNDFGFVALDISYAYTEDSGTYTCVATNAVGQAMTSCNLNCHGKDAIILDTMHQDAMSKITRLESSSKYQRSSIAEDIITQAPVFTAPLRDKHLIENAPLHFEARLIPVGDPDLKVEWFKNNVPLQQANRISTMHDFGYVALDMKYVNPEDSGTYTCRATNRLGQAVTSAALVVSSKESLLLESQHSEALEKLRMLEDSSRYSRTTTEETVITQAPRFVVKLSGLTELWEGQSAHVECRLEPYPDPAMKVEWLHNGKPLQAGHRFRTMYDFGFCAMDILQAVAEDSGTYEVRATNKMGTAVSSITITVKAKSDFIVDTQHPEAMAQITRLEQKGTTKTAEEAMVIEKPHFGRPLRNQERLIEGQAVHLEATLTPVNDPTMKVEWYFNGNPIPSGHRFRTTYDFGFVALDILYSYPEDSGTYMCKATNAAGQAVTSCIIRVEATDQMLLETMDEERMRKIRKLETHERLDVDVREKIFTKPVFTTALQSLDVIEGERVHLECRLEPINDPNLKVEWFMNGMEIKTGHRFRTTHDFGYVALDILYAYEEDSGNYVCKAMNRSGEAVNSCSVSVTARRSIYMDTQHPTGWEKIKSLEKRGRFERLEVADLPQFPPRFTSELRGITALGEGQRAHMEGRIEPIHDPSMRVEWYYNGKLLQSAARFHTTFDFGYVALDMSGAYEEDSGEYTCRAFNSLGEATSTLTLKVAGSGNIIYESARPEGLEKIRELEDASRVTRQISEDLRTFQQPVFTQPLQNIDNLAEGEIAHFECRLIPVGDPSLKVEWFRNEKPIETSSRINRTHDFGYVALDIIGVRQDDEGIYMCRASNDLGEAITTASMRIVSHASIQVDSQHPEGMRKIQAMEERKTLGLEAEPEKAFEKPVFTVALSGPAQVMEGQRAHYECRVVPIGDPSMKFEWYCNGTALKMGSRFHTTNDFGFVTLDIMSVIPEDSGVYMCKAFNAAGEAVSSCSTHVIGRDSILGDALYPGWETIRQRETQWNRVPQAPTTPDAVMEPPMFTKHFESFEKLVEGGSVTLEGQVQPAHDPYLSIEWFKNGVQLATGTRLRSTFDFGHVVLDITGLRASDSGIYTCKATNKAGEATSTCNIKVTDRDWLVGDSVRPEALPKLARLEEPKSGAKALEEPVYDVPVFISHLNNVECLEGDMAHFECRVEPSKDPTMKIEWFINGRPMQAAARYTATYDFGYVALDCSHCYAEDSGIYMCKATNSKGTASTTGTLRCISKANLFFDTQHPQGKAGLQKVEEAERAFWSKYQRQVSEQEITYPKPFFVRPLQSNFSLHENQTLHMEANVEPKNDANLKIEWFLNGKPLEQGARYKTSYDFGLVTLDLSDCYERDQGIYTCRASNKAGEAFCTTTVVVVPKGTLIEGTQHPAGESGLEAIQKLEESLRRSDRMLPDEEGHPPIFTTQFKSLSNIDESEIAHFEAMLAPLGDETMKVEWFYKGEPLKASHRVRTVYAFGMVVLEIVGTKVADTGEYTCKATNKWGTAECSCTLEVVDSAHGQPPKFTTHIQNIEGARDGQSAHFECTLVPIGDPNMKVEWFHNGQPLRNATRIKTVSDFGYVVLDIAYLQSHDSGEWLCKATNKYGEDVTKAFLSCTGKGGVYYDTLQPGSLGKIAELEAKKAEGKSVLSPTEGEPPRFITHITSIDRLAEGQSAHFEARLKPIGDPNLSVEWYKDGKKLPTGHRYRTFHDFGIVILDILYCYEEDSGVYEARAVNKLGQDTTTATLKCSSKANLILTPQVPKEMEGGLDKIQQIEDTAWMRRASTVSEKTGMPPKFTVPLSNAENLKEGENAHFEARLVPTDDPRLKVEWFWNGKSMKFSSRIRQFCDFGFVIMELSPVYPEDSGEYMCRAYNDYGEAVTKATLKCEGKRSIIYESQLPKSMQSGMEKIAELEGLGVKQQVMSPTETGMAPQFITQPQDVTIFEDQLAHFECRLLPIGDPSLRVTWYLNGRPLSAGSRIKTIHDFGFVILELAGCYRRDAGTYTCKAVNKYGESGVECKLTITSKSGIILDPQATGRFKSCTESIQKLEENRFKKEEISFDEEKPFPPRFVTNLENITDLIEGQPAHFDCRVEPVGDSTMKIEWFHNGVSLGAGSRVHMMDDFGFVVLDLEWTFARDSGEYMCRATNKWGQATTSAILQVSSKHGVDLSTQLPQGMTAEKLKELEKGPLTEKYEMDAEITPPKFTVPIKNVAVEEGERAFFEATVEPRTDPNLKVEWYHNGKPLQSGHRFRTSFEMGHVTLELLYTYAEDSGEYVCRAFNKLGQDITKATLKSKATQSVVMQSQVPKGMKKLDISAQMEEALRKYTTEIILTAEDIYDPAKNQPPRFVTHIKDNLELEEMQESKFECQLAPVGDPNMKLEWFFNGRPLPYKNRFMPVYDFGYVALTMQWVFAEDSGEYLCRASNLYGMDETKAFIKCKGKPGVIYESQIPKGMSSLDKIRDLEAQWHAAPTTQTEETEKVRSKPEILKPPESVVVQEGEWVRFNVRVSGYPKPRVMWIVNASTAMNGNRFKLWYDGMFHLDIPKTRQYDSGKVEIIARNSLGEAYGCCDLRVNPRQDDYRHVLKSSPRQHAEGVSEHYRKPDWVIRMEALKEQMAAVKTAPLYIQEITNGRVKEMENHTFTAIFAGNPKPEISWYHNEKLLHQSQSFQMRIRGDKAFLTIVQASPEYKGEYLCKAVNSSGEVTCHAILEVIELSYEEKLKLDNERYAALQIQHAAELMRQKELERKEKMNLEHQEAMARIKEERVVQKVKEPESAKQPLYSLPKKGREVKKEEKKEEEATFSSPTERRIATVYANWRKPLKLEESYPELEPNDFAPNQIPGVKCFVKVTETSMKGEEVIREVAPQFFEDQQIIEELARIHTLLKNHVRVNEIWSMFRAGEFRLLQQPSIQTALVKVCEYIGHHRNVSLVLAEETQEQAKKHPVGLKAFLRMVEHAKDIKPDEIFNDVVPKAMGKFSSTTQELKKVSQMIKEGIVTEEIIAVCEAGKLPTLKKPETQQPLINIVEKQGHTAMITQVLVEEAYKDAKQVKPVPKLETSKDKTQKIETVTVQEVKTELPKLDTAKEGKVESLETATVTEATVAGETVVSAKEIKVGSVMRAINTYIAAEEHENAMHLVEGEKLYAQEDCTAEWCFVEKHLTKERGYVPTKLLEDEHKYTVYVQKKLEEKINKLPVFDKLKKGQKASPPNIIRKLESRVVADGQEVQFTCKVDGMPRPTITWFRQTAIIKPSDEFQMFYSEDNVATLVIKEVFPEDAGMFTCVAKNQAGVAACSAELIVEPPLSDHGTEGPGTSRRSLSRESSVCDLLEGIPPTFAQKTITKEIEEGANLEADVRLVAIPEPEIIWKKDGQVLRDSNRLRIVKQKDVHAYRSIIIIKTVKMEDTGVYEVFVKNREGEAKSSITLRVTAPEKPEFEEKFGDQTVEEDGTIRLVARIRGIPSPDLTWSSTFKRGLESCVVEEHSEVLLECRTSKEKQCKWYKGNTEVTSSERIQIEREGLTHRLVISSAVVSDAGKYKCVFDTTSTWCNLTVKGSEEFVEKLQDIEVQEKETAILEVQVSSESAVVTWHKEGEEITESNEHFQIVSEGKSRKLIIPSSTLSDEGEYTCCLGDLECSCELGVRELPAEIVRKMSNQFVRKGGRATLEVELTKGDAVITWYKDGKEIRFSDHYQLSIDGKVQRLLVYNCELEDSGTYSAVVGKSECSATLTVQLPPTVDRNQLQTDYTIRKGYDVTFTVPFRANPAPKANWLFKGQVIKPSDRILTTISETSASMTVKQVQNVDCGTYTLRMANECGDVSVDFTLKVLDKPSKPGTPEPVQVTNDSITIHWREPDDTGGSPITNYTVEYMSKKSQSWIIYNESVVIKETTTIVTQLENNEEYCFRVSAVNEVGISEVSETSEFIKVAEIVETTAPVVLEELQPVVEVLHKTIVLRCVINGNPTPTVQWFKDGTEITVNTSYENFTATYVIAESDGSSAGNYTCRGTNEAGVVECTASVVIQEMPKFEFDNKYENQHLLVGEKWEVPVKVTGYPHPTITWRKNGEQIESSENMVVHVKEEESTTSITIKELTLKNSGTYSVTAENSAGTATLSFTLLVAAEPPGPPIGPFDVLNQAESSFVLHWDEPLTDGGSPITGYLLEKRETNKKVWQKVGQTAAEVTQLEVTGLKRGSSYFFRVFAINEYGQSLPLQPDEPISTGKKISPPSKPTALQVIDVTSKTISLAWSPPTTSGGADLTGYVIEKRLTTETKWECVTTVEPSVTLFCVENLKEKEEYEFRVFAENPVGLSEEAAYTEKVMLKTHAVPPSPPTAPLEARPTGPNSLMIEWGAPESDGGSPLLGYIIAIRDIKRTMWIEVGQVDANFTRLHIKELQEDHEYMVRVFARNEVGTSEPLETEEPVKIVRPDDFQELPEDDAAPSLSYSTTETLSWMREAGVDADIYSYAKGRLLNRDEYFFKVWHQTKFKEDKK